MTTDPPTAGEHIRVGGRSSTGRAFGVTLATSGATILLGLVSGVLTARFLGADGRGVVAAVSTWTLTLTWASNLSFADGMIFLQSRGADRRRALGTTLVIAPVLGAVGIGIAQILVPIGFSAQSEETRMIARVFLCAVPVVLTTEAMWAMLMARHRFVFLGAVRIAQPAMYVLILIALLGADRFSPVTVLTAQVVSYAVALTVALVGLVSEGISWPDRRLAGRAVGYGLRMQGVTLGALRLDSVALPAFVTATQIGYYSIAVNVSSMVVALFGSVAMVIFPVTASADGPAGRRVLERGLRVNFLGGGVAVLGLAVVAPWLIPFVYGAEFAAAVPPLWLMLPGMVLFSASNALMAALQGLGTPGRASLAHLGGALVLLTGLVLTVPVHGILAAALMSTLGYTVVFLLSYRLVSRRSGLSLRATLSPAEMRQDARWLRERIHRLRERG
ncbi:lipopolysaccharide biosynthesis protein [Janibacter sp. GS2]|uniref:lipopolysaccharide biosynthesis protein n=1 Tax=Janibacter sp. GS2 TaxID=3442646 RepID=UPI003EBEB01B